MSDELVSRLRGNVHFTEKAAMNEAADRIEALTAENAELKALLRQTAGFTDMQLRARIDAVLTR